LKNRRGKRTRGFSSFFGIASPLSSMLVLNLSTR
jgi:hypothetical protein